MTKKKKKSDEPNKYKLTISVDKEPLEIVKNRLSETKSPLSTYVNQFLIYTSNSSLRPFDLVNK